MQSFFDEVSGRWPAGREDYHWHVLWDRHAVQEQLIEQYAGLTRDRPGLEPVPASGVHMTVLHSGPVDEISDDEIGAITALVRQRCAALAPWTAVVDRPTVGRVAVECLIGPGESARQLWQITSEATRQVTGDRFPTIPETYYPHLSLGYGTGTDDPVTRRQMKVWLTDTLTPSPQLPPVTLPVASLHLVAQSHDGRHITWRHITQVPIGSHDHYIGPDMSREAIEAEYLR